MSKPSVESMINQTNGPFLEVGGPSQHLHSAPSIDFSNIEKPVVVTGIQNEHIYKGYWRNRIHPKLGGFFATERPTGWRARAHRLSGTEAALGEDFRVAESHPDAYADATALPIASGSLGALYTRALDGDAVDGFFTREAPRTLETGGILVMQDVKAGMTHDIPPYFDLIRSKKAGKTAVNLVLRRNDIPYSEDSVPSAEQPDSSSPAEANQE